MAVINYSKFKIRLDPDSKHTPGFKVGDVVRRQYLDGDALVYSLMVVLETGVDVIGGKDSPYFVGGLIEGDAPRNEELLDFVRITNLFDEQRGGALYLTASDTEAPYMDVVDSVAKDNSLCYPTNGNIEPDVFTKNKYSFFGGDLVWGEYYNDDAFISRTYKLTRSSNAGSGAYGFRIDINGEVEYPQRILISFKNRSTSPLDNVPISFGYSDHSRLDFSGNISFSTAWQYWLFVFTVDHPSEYQRSFIIDLTDKLGQYQSAEIAELNIVPLSALSQFSDSSKVRIGKVTGVVDPVFGGLEGYGAYFQNLYATKNVNIAGTLTAGDENGFASTFYAGKIHKNVVVNSLDPTFIVGPVVESGDSPTGVGKAWRIGQIEGIEIQTKEWFERHIDHQYCFSIWVKTDGDGVLVFIQNEQLLKITDIYKDSGWRRYHASFTIQDDPENPFYIGIASSLDQLEISSPQLEAGDKPTQYQPTDATLSYVDDYGAWFSKGGIGGTIQNPLLRLNEDGSISSKDGSFVINADGTGHFAGGRFKWSGSEITLRDFTIRWEDLSEDARQNLKGEPNYSLIITSSAGQIFYDTDVATTLSAQVFKGSLDITALLPDDCFLWSRSSRDVVGDTRWDENKFTGREIGIDRSDMNDNAVFHCSVSVPDNVMDGFGAAMAINCFSSETLLNEDYTIKGTLSCENVKAVHLIDATDIFSILSIRPEDISGTDLSELTGKPLLIYAEEQRPGETVHLAVQLNKK